MSYISSRSPRHQFGLRGLEGGAPAQSFKAGQADIAKRASDDTKRTMAITLVALGAGAVGLYFVAGKNRVAPGTPQVFANVAQCVAAGNHPGGVCEAQWNAASKTHDRAAPAYPNMQACEATHGAGKCVKPATPDDPERAAKYIPHMAGYFFGQAPQGTFRGVPLYSTIADGEKNYRVAEEQPKEPDAIVAEKKTAPAEGNNGSGSRNTFLFVPATAAVPAAAAGAMLGAAAVANPTAKPPPVGPIPAVAPAARQGAPAAAANPAAAKPAARGGFGASSKSAGMGAGG